MWKVFLILWIPFHLHASEMYRCVDGIGAVVWSPSKVEGLHCSQKEGKKPKLERHQVVVPVKPQELPTMVDMRLEEEKNRQKRELDIQKQNQRIQQWEREWRIQKCTSLKQQIEDAWIRREAADKVQTMENELRKHCVEWVAP
jgi:hypothetical protein